MSRTSVILALLCVVAGANAATAGEQAAKLSEPVAVAEGEGGRPQYSPDVAWSAAAKCWLAVWHAGEATGDGTAGDGRAQDIYAARISEDGKVLDPEGIAVCKAKDFQCRPSVASDGKDFLVVWHDLRTGKDWDLYAARVTGEGKVLDEDGFLVSGGPHNQCFGDIVFGGGSYFAAWLDMRHFPEYRVYGARISPAGKVLDAAGTELVRMMSDKGREAWRKAPYSPGKKGLGWHNFGRKLGGMLQAGPPDLCTDGTRHLVCARKMSSSEFTSYALRLVDAASGRPAGGQGSTLPALQHKAKERPVISRCRWVRARHAAVGKAGFLGAHYQVFSGFGAGGSGAWIAATVGADGKPDDDAAIVYPELKQSTAWGYRTFSLRPNVLALAWDGKRALYVSERHIQKDPGNPRMELDRGDIDVLGIFVDGRGRRITDLATGSAVEPDVIKKAGLNFEVVGEIKVAPFGIATGLEAYQANPAAAAGAEGRFLVVWQEALPGKPSRITARVVSVK